MFSSQLFGKAKLEWLRRFFPYKHGIPSHDVLGKLFCRLDPIRFNECFMDWINSFSYLTKGEVIAFDGKSICSSVQAGMPKSAVHVVSAYAVQTGLCLKQVGVDRKKMKLWPSPACLNYLPSKGASSPLTRWGTNRRLPAKSLSKTF